MQDDSGFKIVTRHTVDPLAAVGSTVRDHYGEGHEFGFVHVEFVVPFTMSVFHRDQIIVANRGYPVIEWCRALR